MQIWTQYKAIEGISGAGVLYTAIAVLLTCCLAGTFLSFVGLVFDILFMGAFAGVAIMTRRGANSCSGFVHTPLGDGNVNAAADGYGPNGFGSGQGQTLTYRVNYGQACRMNKAAFAVAISGAVLFLMTAIMQLLIWKNHKKEKRYGPGPNNDYTSGSGNKGFFAKRKAKKQHRNAEKDAEIGAAGADAYAADRHHQDREIRQSHETGTTVGNNAAAPYDKVEPARDNHVLTTHGGFYTQPQGTGVNPYGYDNNGEFNTMTAPGIAPEHTHAVPPTTTTRGY